MVNRITSQLLSMSLQFPAHKAFQHLALAFLSSLLPLRVSPQTLTWIISNRWQVKKTQLKPHSYCLCHYLAMWLPLPVISSCHLMIAAR